jgi:hypothetical protein
MRPLMKFKKSLSGWIYKVKKKLKEWKLGGH